MKIIIDMPKFVVEKGEFYCITYDYKHTNNMINSINSN